MATRRRTVQSTILKRSPKVDQLHRQMLNEPNPEKVHLLVYELSKLQEPALPKAPTRRRSTGTRKR
jgi:hypothetical protein